LEPVGFLLGKVESGQSGGVAYVECGAHKVQVRSKEGRAARVQRPIASKKSSWTQGAG
jgi:hypothetical protein